MPSPRPCGTNMRPWRRPASSCRSTVRTWAWAGISNTQTLSLPEFRKRASMHVEALNHALANIPAEQLRIHLCSGDYRGPPPLRRGACRDHRYCLPRQAARHLS